MWIIYSLGMILQLILEVWGSTRLYPQLILLFVVLLMACRPACYRFHRQPEPLLFHGPPSISTTNHLPSFMYCIKAFSIVFSDRTHIISLFRCFFFSLVLYHPSFSAKWREKPLDCQTLRLHLPHPNSSRFQALKRFMTMSTKSLKSSMLVTCSSLKKS